MLTTSILKLGGKKRLFGKKIIYFQVLEIHVSNYQKLKV
jgi:hypothetical protein